MGSDKRRSDRLMLTVPLTLSGADSKGAVFKDSARTVTLNRHGARIVSPRLLTSGQTIQITNLVSRREAVFRVVGPLSPHSEKGGEWGVELLDGQENIWGIQFPPPPPGQDAESAALLECRQCHTVALLRVSLVEFEVLGAAGLLTKTCENCQQATPWGHAEKQVAMNAPPDEAAMMAQAGAAAARGGIDLRRHRRVALQLPVLVRDFSGHVEITKSENVSKGGFCFSSQKDYHVGEGVMVACPYSGRTDQSLEVSAKIVRRQKAEGAGPKIYGVRYNKK
jgi:hypothetical protein